jgi:WD40 repeat protein
VSGGRAVALACALAACHGKDPPSGGPAAPPAPGAAMHQPAVAFGSARLTQGRIEWLAYDGDALLALSWDGVIAGDSPDRQALEYLARWDLGTRAIAKRTHLGSPITDASFAPPAGAIAVATLDQHVLLLDARTLAPRWDVAAGDGEISCIAAAPDGSLVMVGRENGALDLLDSAGTRVWSAAADGHYASVCAFSPDGRMFASGGAAAVVTVRDAATRGVIAQLAQPAFDPDRDRPGGVLSLAFAPDSASIATGGWDDQVRVFALPSGARTRAFVAKSDPFAVAWSSDGAWLAYGGRGHEIALWRASDGTPGPTMEGGGDATSALAFSPDGKTLASGSWDKTIRRWTVTTGAEEGEVGHADAVRTLGLAADGVSLVSVGADRRVIAWDAAHGAERGRFVEPSYYRAYAIAPDATAVARIDASGLAVVDVPSGKPRFVHDLDRAPFDEQLAFSADGARVLASIDGELRVYDARTGAEARALAKLPVAFSLGFADADRAAWWVDGDGLHVVDAATGAARTTVKPGGRVTAAAAMSPDGKSAAINERGGTVSVWDVARGALRFQRKDVFAPVFSPDGRALVVSAGNELVVLDAVTGAVREHLPSARGGFLSTVAYAADGELVAAEGSLVDLWRVRP